MKKIVREKKLKTLKNKFIFFFVWLFVSLFLFSKCFSFFLPKCFVFFLADIRLEEEQ